MQEVTHVSKPCYAQMREWGQGCPSVIISNLAKEVGYQRTVTGSKVIDVCVCVCACVCELVVANSLWSHGLWPTWFHCP